MHFHNRHERYGYACLAISFVVLGGQLFAADTLSYQEDIAPILTKYCAGCHNDTDREGDFSVSSLAALRAGTPEGGQVVLAGKASESKLWQLLTGTSEPKMPPEDEPAPTAEEMEQIRRWIEDGMREDAPEMELISSLSIPQLTPAEAHQHYLGSATAVGMGLALGKLGRVELIDLDSGRVRWTLSGLPGKVNSLRASADGKQVVVGTGIAGVGGEIDLVDIESGQVVARFQGHADAVYCAALSPDGKWLASGSYDRRIILWNVDTGEAVREFTGHNGAIYDLDFDPTGQVLATASADQTVKLWNVHSGQRLDTLGQPEGEMLCVRFSADGNFVFAAGADRQIRQWQVASKDQPAINPMRVARYAHEADILQLQRFGSEYLLSASHDRTVKLWSVADLKPYGEVARLEDIPVALCSRDHGEVAGWVVELTGARHEISRQDLHSRVKQTLRADLSGSSAPENLAADASPSGETTTVVEVEPNHDFTTAVPVDLPVVLEGKISAAEVKSGGDAMPLAEDIDLYRFQAKKGEKWIFEVHAASNKSKLDSRIDLLDEYGKPVLRTRMQAVRESYFTFRGKDSSTSDDFRLHKWEDMELDEYLYSSGEITRLWLYPRGPDSGFKVYPGTGARATFFDTTPVAHALGEPAYVVRELAAGEQALPNGLPVFPLYYENDDDGQRRAGRDSRLTFTAPQTGNYFLRIRDARGFDGDSYTYRVRVRRPQPDFSITVSGHQMTVPRGSGREWKVAAKRNDGLSAPISIFLEGLPEGILATNPLIIESGQQSALGTVYAAPGVQFDSVEASNEKTEGGAQSPTEEASDKERPKAATVEVSLIAHCEIEGRRIERPLKEKLQLTLSDTQEVQLKLLDNSGSGEELEELTLRPGETISARVVVERNGEKSRIEFGKDDSGRNLPHGAYVDNIGLNGLLIPESQHEREFFITGAPKLKPGRRQFHLRSGTKGNPTSRPVWLNVLPAQPR